jgi:hypothetical protein
VDFQLDEHCQIFVGKLHGFLPSVVVLLRVHNSGSVIDSRLQNSGEITKKTMQNRAWSWQNGAFCTVAIYF